MDARTTERCPAARTTTLVRAAEALTEPTVLICCTAQLDPREVPARCAVCTALIWHDPRLEPALRRVCINCCRLIPRRRPGRS